MDERLKEMLMDLTRKESLAVQKEWHEKLNVPFEWPSVEDQVYGHGYIGDYKRGRAKNYRLMYYIPGVELENGLKMPGFVCHPDMAVPAAKELLRLAQEAGGNKNKE